MNENAYIVYVKTDEQGRIRAVDSSYNSMDFTGWTQIDEGTEYKHSHAMSNYLSGLYTDDGIPRYKLADGAPVLRSDEEIEADRGTIPAPAPDITPQLRVAAMAFAATATTIPDAQALEMPDLFPAWETVLAEGKELAADRVIIKGGQLYRVVQAVTPIESQPPGSEGMLAVYRPIETQHAGTQEDPIPFVYGMDALEGLFYSYNGALYQVAEGGSMQPCVWLPDSGIWQWILIEKE